MSNNHIAVAMDTAQDINGNSIKTLGNLIWYSIKNTRIELDQLYDLMKQTGMSIKFLPKATSPIGAFKMATSEVNELYKEDLSNNRHAVYMIRLVSNLPKEIIKSITKEIRDDSNKTLEYTEIGRVHFSKSDKDAKQLRFFKYHIDCNLIESAITTRYESYVGVINGPQIRRMFLDIIESMSPTKVRPSGAVYFIPYQQSTTLAGLQKLSRSLEPFGTTSWNSTFETIPLVDAENSRKMIEKRFDEQNTQEIDACMEGLAKLLRNPTAEKKDAAEYILKVKSAKAQIAEYEKLLNTKLVVSQTKVELLNKQVTALLDKIASRYIGETNICVPASAHA